MQARTLIDSLDLKPHPEGGCYREIYRSSERVQTARGARCAITAIYYLLERNQISRWHVVEADEIWHFYEGAPLELLAYDPEPQALVRSLGDFSLVGCNVGPGFDFEDFRLVAGLSGHLAHFKGTLAPFASLL